jgi:putative ABC transport system permease protein
MLSEVWSDVRYRLRAVFRRADMERELEAELAFHVEQEAEKYVAMGMSTAEARRRARLAFGGMEGTKEGSRDARGTQLLETVIRDVRYALRSPRRTPGFTLTAVVCLGLGIGATSTVFGIVDALFFRPPPGLGDPAGIVRPYITVKSAHIFMDASGETSYPAYVEIRDNAHSLSGLAAYGDVTLSVGDGLDARREDGLVVSGNYFSVLRLRPAPGRFFVPGEDAGPGSPPVAVVSWAYWRGRLGGRSDVIGTRLELDGHWYTIVGVAPREFHGIDTGAPAVWVPVSHVADLGYPPDELQLRTSWWFRPVGRLASGVTRGQAQSELAPRFTRALRRAWGADIDPRIVLGPVLAARGPSPSTQARIARWLALAAVLLLAIACANAANLLLARAVTRRKELTVRLSLGAGRGRVVRQLLTESGLIALGATALGLLLARWGTAALPAVGLPSLSFFAHGRVLAFAVVVAVASVLLFGLAPAVAASQADLAAAVKEGAREGVDHRSRLRTTLMVAQVAVAAVLLVGAGLFVHSLRNVQSIRPGFDLDRLLMGSGDLATAGYSDTAAAAFFDRALDRLERLRGVQAVTLASSAPLSGGSSITAYSVPDGTSGAPASTLDLQQSMQGSRAITVRVGPRYFATVGTPIVAGRDFTAQDRAGAPVVIVNRAFAEHEWSGRSALGRCIDIGWKQDITCYRVVGVAADAKYVSLQERRRMVFFQPIQRDPAESRLLLIRATGDPAALAPAVREALAGLDPRLPYVELKTLTDVLRPELQPRRLDASLFRVFGVLALLLAAVGLYGVVSYTVAQRTHELGVRMALGARRTQVLGLVMGRGVRLALTGLAIGVGVALAGTRFVTHLLYGVTATDPLTFAGVALLLFATATLASLVPGYRATRVEPVVALRVE